MLRRIARFARPHWKMLALSVLLMPASSGLQLVQPLLIKEAVDGPIAHGNAGGLLPWAVTLLLVLLLNYTLQFVQAYASQAAGQGIVHDLRVAVHDHVVGLHLRWFLQNPAGRVLTRCTSDPEGIGEMFAAGFLTLFADLLLLVGICAALLLLDLRLALLTFVTLPLLFGVSQWFQSRLRDTFREIRRRVAVLNAYLQERISGIQVVQLFVRERRTYEEFRDRSRELMDENLRSIRLDAALFAFVDMMGHLVVALLLWWAARPVLEGALSFGALVAFVDYVGRFFQPIRDLSTKVATMQAGLASAEKVFGMLDVDDRVPEPPSGKGHAPGRARGEILCDSVHFGYSVGSEVLRGLDLRVAPGERVALVGATGAGKSTLLRLLDRAWDVDSGAVRLDGVDVRDWALPALRRSVGMVLQDVFLFEGSVRDNISLGDPRIDDAAVRRAVIQVGAEELVTRLGGLEGRLAERGGNVSAGERQLLAFARVLAYEPAVLLLDEATSNVDTFSEERIQSAIATAMSGRTTLVVAHRLSTIQQVDRIAVLHRGKVAEIGSHSDLMAKDGGLYRRLYESYYAAGPGAAA
jgi:ATP-binding cassette subfamily B protein